MRVLICGDRHWPLAHREPIVSVIAGLMLAHQELTVIQGGARGADGIAKTFADTLARTRDEVTSLTYPALWNEHDREGRTKVPCRCHPTKSQCLAAGPRRNQQMLDEGQPAVVYAFHDYIENSKGTKDMVNRADAANIPVYVVSRHRQSVTVR